MGDRGFFYILLYIGSLIVGSIIQVYITKKTIKKSFRYNAESGKLLYDQINIHYNDISFQINIIRVILRDIIRELSNLDIYQCDTSSLKEKIDLIKQRNIELEFLIQKEIGLLKTINLFDSSHDFKNIIINIIDELGSIVLYIENKQDIEFKNKLEDIKDAYEYSIESYTIYFNILQSYYRKHTPVTL